MADLDRNEQTNPVRIVGDDGAGNESTPVQSTIDGKLKTETTIVFDPEINMGVVKVRGKSDKLLEVTDENEVLTKTNPSEYELSIKLELEEINETLKCMLFVLKGISE